MAATDQQIAELKRLVYEMREADESDDEIFGYAQDALDEWNDDHPDDDT
ncbi:MAG TPA: hypothetical protein VGE97_07275 [Nitrososphaera sp.]|jgi:hypothetical protein